MACELRHRSRPVATEERRPNRLMPRAEMGLSATRVKNEGAFSRAVRSRVRGGEGTFVLHAGGFGAISACSMRKVGPRSQRLLCRHSLLRVELERHPWAPLMHLAE